MKWTQGESYGIIVAGQGGMGKEINKLDLPSGMVVDSKDNLWITDMANHRVMKYNKGAHQGTQMTTGWQALKFPTDIKLNSEETTM